MTSEDDEPMALMSRAKAPNDSHRVSTGGRGCTWHPPKEGKESKRRRKVVVRDEKGVDRHVVSNRARSRLLNALRPSGHGEVVSSDDEKARTKPPSPA